MTDREEILEEIKALSSHYPRRQLGSRDQLRWLEDYANDLATFRPIDVNLVCAMYRQSDATRMATSGELIAKLRGLVAHDHISVEPPPKRQVGQDERERVKWMLADFLANRPPGLSFADLARRSGETEVDQGRRLWPNRERKPRRETFA